MKDFQENDLHLIAATPTGSILVHFLCETFHSIVVLKEMVNDQRMKIALETIFNSLLVKSESLHITLTVSLDPKEYQSSINDARRKSKS